MVAAVRKIFRNQFYRKLAVILCCGIIGVAIFSAWAAKPSIEKTPAFDRFLYRLLMDRTIGELDDLTAVFDESQRNYMRIMPPGMLTLAQQDGLRLMRNARLARHIITLVDCEVWRGIGTYPVIVTEDPETRERVCLTRSREELLRSAPPADYDPWSLLSEQHPELSRMSADEQAVLRANYDPSRIVLVYRLITRDSQ